MMGHAWRTLQTLCFLARNAVVWVWLCGWFNCGQGASGVDMFGRSR